MSDSAPALAGATAVVTGASRGFGRHIAQGLWRDGASLLVVARDGARLEQLCGELPEPVADGQRARAFAIDLSQPDAASRVQAASTDAFGGADVLVNNAGMYGPIGPLETNDWDAWVASVHLNLLAVVGLCRAFVPQMRARGRGKIVNLAGGGATAGRPRFSAYATAKAAVVRFSEGLAIELAESRIDVNCVAPGALETEIHQDVIDAGADRAGADAVALAEKVAAGGGASMDRAGDLVRYLCSPASDGVTGRLISAVWDPWETLAERCDELAATDIYTLRRIVPGDRGRDWE